MERNSVSCPTGYSRRKFLKGSAAAAGVAALTGISSSPFVLAQQSPADKLRVAVIGAAGMGGYSVGCALSENLVAMVDVDEKNIAQVMKDSVKDTAKPKIFYDYRKMLDECHKDLDVVLIATPDHHHAPAAIRAINYGKHVFCQKPLAHNIAECYALAKAAREKKVLTQMGNQYYCGEAIRRVAEYIAAGAIGTRHRNPHACWTATSAARAGGPPPSPSRPACIGTNGSARRPIAITTTACIPFHGADWKAFGTGTIGDMACHRLCFPFMALRLWEVKKFTVECLNTKNGSDEKYPQDNVVCYHIPARDAFPACKCYVYDHQELRPEVMKELEKKYAVQWSEPTLFVGTKGYLNNHSRIIPESEHQKFPVPPKTLVRPKAGGPIEDLYACIRAGGTPVSNFTDAAGPLTAMALTGHLAQYAGIGSKIEWDVEKMQCTNQAGDQ